MNWTAFVEQPLALPGSANKLDGVGPLITDPPLNSSTNLSKEKKKNILT